MAVSTGRPGGRAQRKTGSDERAGEAFGRATLGATPWIAGQRGGSERACPMAVDAGLLPGTLARLGPRGIALQRLPAAAGA